MNPYARHVIAEDDVHAVEDVLRSGWLTCGPAVARFEEALARVAGTQGAVAASSGTAALHCAMHAVGVGPGDEVVVPALTFAATSNAVLYQGGTPVFADVDPETLLPDTGHIRSLLTPRTKAVVTVDYAGQPSDYDALAELCRSRGIAFVADACHSLGARHGGRPVGSLADLTVFSFHPAKHVACGEGGAIVGNDAALLRRMRAFRNHGIDSDPAERARTGTWRYEMTELGFNYRITDIQCALGLSQLSRLPESLALRRRIAAAYDAAFAGTRGAAGLVRPLARAGHVEHAYHLYVVRIDFSRAPVDRQGLFLALRDAGVGANVHYLPVYLHPYYRRLGMQPGLCPRAEAAYEQIVSLPMHAAMDEEDARHAARSVLAILEGTRP